MSPLKPLPPSKRLGWRAARWARSKRHGEAVEAFRRACELALGNAGVHGDGTVSVARYPYAVAELAGDWVTYVAHVREGEDFVGTHGDGQVTFDQTFPFPSKGTPFPVQRPSNLPRWGVPVSDDRNVAVMGLQLAQTFLAEAGANLAPFHKGQPGRWTAYGWGVTGKGQLKPIGEKQLSATTSIEAATNQAVDRIDQWLSGIVYSSSDIGAVERIWLSAKIAY